MTYRSLQLATGALLLSGCAAPTVLTQSAGCSSLIPSSWSQGVAPAPLPEGDTIGDWIAFADSQTGKLDTANDRTRSTIEIVSRCEARDQAAVKKAARRRIFGL